MIAEIVFGLFVGLTGLFTLFAFLVVIVYGLLEREPGALIPGMVFGTLFFLSLFMFNSIPMKENTAIDIIPSSVVHTSNGSTAIIYTSMADEEISLLEKSGAIYVSSNVVVEAIEGKNFWGKRVAWRYRVKSKK